MRHPSLPSMCRLLAAALLAGAAIACDERQSLGVDPAPTFSVSSAPTNANSFAVSQSQISVVWQDNSPNESGFEVHRSTIGASGPFARLASTGPGVTSYSDQGLTPATEYCYRVRAFRITGKSTSYSEFSNVTCTRTPGPPAAPTNLIATPPFSSAVDVTWIDSSNTETGFRIEHAAVVEGPWTAVVSTGPNVTSHRDWGRTSEQQVCYRVVAFNAVGDSPASNTDCTVPPAAPTNLIATRVDAQTVDLVWTDNSSAEDGYAVLRATGSAPLDAVAQLPANSTSYRDGSAGANVPYSYQVRANRDGGFSDVSNTATVGLGSCEIVVSEDCGNGLDDDCDGLVDTDDDDCQCFAHPCPPGFVCDGWSGLCYPQDVDGVLNGDESDVSCGGQPISGGQL